MHQVLELISKFFTPSNLIHKNRGCRQYH